MILDLNLAKCTSDTGLHLMIQEKLPFEILENFGFSIASNFNVELNYKCTFEYVIVKGQGSVYLMGNCFRCGDKIKRMHTFVFDEKFLPEIKHNSDDDNFYYYSGDSIDITKMIIDSLILSLPNQFLCKDDCKGLCPQCFANLNTQKCVCKPHITNAFACLNDIIND